VAERRDFKDPGSLRAVASYLVQLRRPLNKATQARKSWVHRIGVLMEDARRGNPLTITQSAGQIGRELGVTFREAREDLHRLTPPLGCNGVHTALDKWLDRLVASCDLLVEVARVGDMRRLRDTQALFAEGRRHAHQFNEEYARIVTELRTRVAAAEREKAAKSKGGAQRAPAPVAAA
jgi:hypothetical protein